MNQRLNIRKGFAPIVVSNYGGAYKDREILMKRDLAPFRAVANYFLDQNLVITLPEVPKIPYSRVSIDIATQTVEQFRTVAQSLVAISNTWETLTFGNQDFRVRSLERPERWATETAPKVEEVFDPSQPEKLLFTPLNKYWGLKRTELVVRLFYESQE